MREHNINDISKIGLYGLAYKENVDDTRESPTLQLLKRMDEHLAFGVKVYAVSYTHLDVYKRQPLCFAGRLKLHSSCLLFLQ